MMLGLQTTNVQHKQCENTRVTCEQQLRLARTKQKGQNQIDALHPRLKNTSLLQSTLVVCLTQHSVCLLPPFPLPHFWSRCEFAQIAHDTLGASIISPCVFFLCPMKPKKKKLLCSRSAAYYEMQTMFTAQMVGQLTNSLSLRKINVSSYLSAGEKCRETPGNYHCMS